MEGGLAGAASGASDMVDDSDAAKQRGTAASDLRVRKQLPVCACGCVSAFSSGRLRVSTLQIHTPPNPIAQPATHRHTRT